MLAMSNELQEGSRLETRTISIEACKRIVAYDIKTSSLAEHNLIACDILV